MCRSLTSDRDRLPLGQRGRSPESWSQAESLLGFFNVYIKKRFYIFKRHYENVETFFKWFECFRNKLIEWNHNDVGCRSSGRKHKERKAATVLDANAASQRSQGDERWWRSSSAREGHCTLWHLLWRKKVPDYRFTFSIFQTNTAQSVWCFQPRGGVLFKHVQSELAWTAWGGLYLDQWKSVL